jgi:hypothetical protein
MARRLQSRNVRQEGVIDRPKLAHGARRRTGLPGADGGSLGQIARSFGKLMSL